MVILRKYMVKTAIRPGAVLSALASCGNAYKNGKDGTIAVQSIKGEQPEMGRMGDKPEAVDD